MIVMEDMHGYMDNSDRNDYRRNDHRRDNRGGGRRRDRKPRDRMRRDRAESQENMSGESGDMVNGSQMRTPVILAKKGLTNDGQKKDAPAILSIQRRDGIDPSSSGGNTSNTSIRSYSSDTSGYHRHAGSSSRHEKTSDLVSPATPSQPQQTSHVEHHIPTGLAALDISPEAYPSEAISLIDANFMWNEKPFESLLDQSDFVVVGCVGMQGVGKSLLLSMIAGQNIEITEKMRYIFRPQKKSDMEKCLHRTVGIDMYVTKERMILLDTQPLLSPSMLDQYLRYDRKVPSEYSTAEICLEVQALQILTFLYTVCNIVVVAQDHFNDFVLLNLLKTAEMLKPSTISNSQDGAPSAKHDEFNEFFPYLVFVYTCCDERAFETDVVYSMCDVIWKVFCDSRLRVRGSASMVRSSVLPYRNEERFFNYQDVNLFFMPSFYNNIGADANTNPINRYHGHPSMQTLTKILRQQLASVPREPLTHHMLSERNWFHYAARTWEAVKKSKLVAEYHRLLSS